MVRRFLRLHPWVIELLLAGSYAVLALALAGASLAPPVAATPWIPLLLAAGGVAVVLLRRRAPALLFAAAAVLFLLSAAWGTAAEIVLPAIMLYAVGSHRSSLAAWLCFVGGGVLAVLAGGVFVVRDSTPAQLLDPTRPPTTGDPWNDILNLAIIFVIPLLVATLLGTNAGERRRYEAALVERAAQLARDRDQQAEIARAGERERIAREMHDVIAHSLSVMIALADGARAAASERPAVAADAMDRVSETGRRTLGEVRRLLTAVGSDHAPAHAPQPGAAQLAELVEEFGRAGLPARLTVDGAPPADPARELTVYRIVQESLTNSLRHANDVTGVEVLVSWSADGASVLVEDDAAPAAPPADAGRGILGIRERAALFGGSVEAGPRESGGWRVFVRLGEVQP